MKGRILHIMNSEKFLPPFIDFVTANLDCEDHRFLFVGKNPCEYGIQKDSPAEFLSAKKHPLAISSAMYKAEKIIIHGLWVTRFLRLIYFQPWLLKKCYWVMWGGDFYNLDDAKIMKKSIIKNVGHAITYLRGDYELAQKWFGMNAEYHECFMYPSNVYKPLDIPENYGKTVNILMGNSANKTNNHLEAFDMLLKYKEQDIKIYAPLSYGGEKDYALEIAALGKRLFGDKFVPLLDFMNYDKYLELLGSINIAVFNHDRQQAMGNTISLLGMGKKVYIKSSITPWELFSEIGVKVFDIAEFDLEPIGDDIRTRNKARIAEYFSQEKYILQLQGLFK